MAATHHLSDQGSTGGPDSKLLFFFSNNKESLSPKRGLLFPIKPRNTYIHLLTVILGGPSGSALLNDGTSDRNGVDCSTFLD